MKLIVTAADVIHSFGVPSFWVKMDAVPGQLNETWFKVDRPGVYYGQCYELCGARHGFMPIAVEVVRRAQFAPGSPRRAATCPAPSRPVRGRRAAGPGRGDDDSRSRSRGNRQRERRNACDRRTPPTAPDQ